VPQSRSYPFPEQVVGQAHKAVCPRYQYRRVYLQGPKSNSVNILSYLYIILYYIIIYYIILYHIVSYYIILYCLLYYIKLYYIILYYIILYYVKLYYIVMLSCFIVVFWGPEPTPPKDKKLHRSHNKQQRFAELLKRCSFSHSLSAMRSLNWADGTTRHDTTGHASQMWLLYPFGVGLHLYFEGLITIYHQKIRKSLEGSFWQ
jgi:hypothetical protein